MSRDKYLEEARRRRAWGVLAVLAVVYLALVALMCAAPAYAQDDDALLDLLAGLEARVAAIEDAIAPTWRGIRVAPETRCAPYARSDYRWRGKVRRIREELIDRDGGWDLFAGAALPDGRIDVDHVVAVSEAHDSGGCSWPAGRRRDFGNWRGNLVATRASINRSKGGRDAAEWLPAFGKCELAGIVIETRRHWDLSIDRSEAAALDQILATCE